MTEAGVPRVVATKLTLPAVPAHIIARDRLTRLLAGAGEAPLTVVCAPAGFGKTTAVVEWLNRAGGPCVWVSADTSDNDPRRLCAHLLAGLDQVLPAAMVDAEAALVGGSDLVETIVPAIATTLANRAADYGDRLAIVIDDYHLIIEPACHTLLLAVVDSLPSTVRMVVSSRTLPPLRLARRRAARALADIGPDELAFQGAEAELLLNGALRLGLTSPQIATIDERIDGWPAGLALVASSLPAKPERDDFLAAFARSQGTVADYLIDEVLDATDERVREFLCRTSILSRLSGPLCAAVLEDPGAAELLAEVRRSNLFVTVLDGEWMRYHHLFAELLERELRNSSPKDIPELHRRAAAWFESAGLPEEAIRHASAAGDGEYAAGLLYEHWYTPFDQRRYATLRQLIAHLPCDRGALAFFCDGLDALCMGLDGVDLRHVAQRLDALEPHRDAPGVAPLLDLTRVSPYYGDIGRAVTDGWGTWERYPDLRAETAGGFGCVLWWAGDHDDVHRIVEPYLRLIARPSQLGWGLAALALTATDEGAVDLAERYAREAVEVAVAGGGESALESHVAYVALGEALRLQGALDHAAEQLAIAAHLTSKVPGSLYEAFTLTFDAQLHLTAGDRRRARALAQAAHKIIDGYPDTGVLADRLAAIEATLQHGGAGGVARGSQPTAAELRVLALLATDLTREQIADELYLSSETVRSHIRRLYRRLGAHSRSEAIAIASARRLIEER